MNKEKITESFKIYLLADINLVCKLLRLENAEKMVLERAAAAAHSTAEG